MGKLWLPDSRLEMPELLTPMRSPTGNVKLDHTDELARDMLICMIGDHEYVNGGPTTFTQPLYRGPGGEPVYNGSKDSYSNYLGSTDKLKKAREITVTFWGSSTDDYNYTSVAGVDWGYGSSIYGTLGIRCHRRLGTNITQRGAFEVSWLPSRDSFASSTNFGFSYNTATDLPFYNIGWKIVTITIPLLLSDTQLTMINGEAYSHNSYIRQNDTATIEPAEEHYTGFGIGGIGGTRFPVPTGTADFQIGGVIVHDGLLGEETIKLLHKNPYQSLVST